MVVVSQEPELKHVRWKAFTTGVRLPGLLDTQNMGALLCSHSCCWYGSEDAAWADGLNMQSNWAHAFVVQLII